METKLQLQADFQPYCSWRREEHQEVLEVHLKGYKKDQLHACIDDKGEVTICGKKETGCKKVDGCCEIIKVSTDCKSGGIDVKFSNGILYLKMPKRTRWCAIQNRLKTAATTLELGAVAALLVAAAVQLFVGCK